MCVWMTTGMQVAVLLSCMGIWAWGPMTVAGM